MTIKEYFKAMLYIGHKRPSIHIWQKSDGTIAVSASHLGTCGHGTDPVSVEDIEKGIQGAFDHINGVL